MNKTLNKTKSKLIIIFYFSILLIILLFGVVYFSTKYIKEIRVENNEFQHFLSMIEKGQISINDIINIQSKIDRRMFSSKTSPGVGNIINSNINPELLFNYILIDNNKNIISSIIRDDIKQDLIIEIYQNDNYLKKSQKSGFFIKKYNFDEDEKVLIIIKGINYNISDYINDILGFLIISILFSLFILLFSRKFINKLFIPIEENINDMRQFIHNAGHELKTPISVIDSNLQLINELEKYDSQMISELKNETIKLNSLIESLIKLTSLDILKEKQDINLYGIIQEILNNLKDKINSKNIKTNILIDKNIKIKASRDYFYIFLSNLIKNSIKYNNQGGEINIEYKSGELIISDSGIGIKKEHIDKIFDRFFKVDKSRNTEGFGIGLSLVKKIANIYKWNINVESNGKNYTSFIIKF